MATPQGTVWRPGKDKIGNGPVVLNDGDKLTTISPSLPDGYTSIFTSGPAKDKLFYAIQTDGKVTYALFKDGVLRRQFSTLQELADSNADIGFQINEDNINKIKSRMIEIFNQAASSAGLITSAPSIDPDLSKTPSSTSSILDANVTASVTSFLNSLGVDVDTLKLDKELPFKFGAVDDVIRKMPLLNYPEDALYNKTQDHLSIAQYSYKPPRKDDIFGNPLNTLRNGSKRTTPLQAFLGMVNLPMPNNITDSNNVSWADDNMNNLSAALTSYVTNDPLKTLGGAAGLRALASVAGVGGGAAQIASLLSALGTIGAFKGKPTPEMKTLIGGAVNSQVLSMLGVNVSPESILARGYGIVPNSNIELLFNAPTLREFTFQYRMSPRSSSEAKIINNIIRFFKQGMAAKKISSISGGGSAGAQSYFLGTPNVFQLQYKTTGGKTIKGVNRIKTCALTGFAMNYAADGNWAAYDEGQPVSVIMNMSFKELEPVYDTDYQENVEDGRNADKNPLGDLYPISDDEVGY